MVEGSIPSAPAKTQRERNPMEADIPLHDSVAQLDRVTDYESVGLGFESLPGHHRQLMHFV